MASRAELQALRERVRAATGPDRRMDVELANGVRHPIAPAPRYTSSIDAGLALVEWLLPGWRYDLDNMPGDDGADFVTWLQPGDMNLEGVCRPGATMPLAILDALLSALIAQQPAPQEPGCG